MREVEHLRLNLFELRVATVHAQVGFSLFTDFTAQAFTPASMHEREGHAMLDQLIAWGTALKTLRAEQIPDENNALLAEGIG